MCQFRSGIAVRVDESTVRVYMLSDDDSHEEIRKHYRLTDDGELSRYQTPVELVPVRGLFRREDYDFVFDAGKPDWWVDGMMEQAVDVLFPAALTRLEGTTGDLNLRSLVTLPEGVTLHAGGDLDLYSLTTMPEGVTLHAGGYLNLRSLTTLPEGVTLHAGGYLNLYSLTTMPEGVTLHAGGYLYLSVKYKSTLVTPTDVRVSWF